MEKQQEITIKVNLDTEEAETKLNELCEALEKVNSLLQELTNSENELNIKFSK